MRRYGNTKFEKVLTLSTGLTVPQLLCLRHIRRHGLLTPGTLASYLFVGKATVTGILDRLEARGMVKRERDGSDRRKVFVALTQEGERLAREAVWPLQEQFARRLADLSGSQCERIRDTLSLISDMMEPAGHVLEKPGGNSGGDESGNRRAGTGPTSGKDRYQGDF